MNIRPPWIEETTLPIPLLTSAAHAREFAQTDVFVHYEPQPDRCSACRGECPTPAACELPIAQATKPPRAAFWLLRLITWTRLCWYRWDLQCLRDERDHYRALGWIGPVYLRNSWQQELRLLRVIRQLENT